MEPRAESPPLETKPEIDSSSKLPPHWRRLTTLYRLIVLPTIAIMMAMTIQQATSLWQEWQTLRVAQDNDLNSRVMGFHDVTPDFNYATPPGKWVRDDGDRTLLWAGWDRHANKHLWFTLPKGEIDPRHLTHPMGRDTLRAIDHARTQTKGGDIWEFMPPDHLVVVAEIAGLPLAYPLRLLDKVVAVNDTVNDRPLLLVYTPFVHSDRSVDLFDATLSGKKRFNMGHSGYLWDRKPLLYDREGESLWVSEPQGLVSIAGPRKGTVLKRLAHLTPTRWGEWSREHPDGRLLVGANRTKKVASN